MSFPDKLELLEALWDDLRKQQENQSPEWHKAILDERQRRIEFGEEKFSDWETAN